MVHVTRTSDTGVAPICFPSHSRLPPIPRGLRAHTHAIPLLVDHTLALPFLVIFPLIIFLSTCTISARQISSSLLYAPSTLPVPILLYPEPLTLLLVYDIATLYPYHPRSVTQFPLTLTLLPVPDPSSLSACLSLYYYLWPGLCSFPLCI
jgi:hypothetical protein